jgi:hypothetical protein
MTITQTVEVTDSRRLILEISVPREVPNGRTNVIIQFPVKSTGERDIEIINKNAERLNREAMDVLSYQNMYLDCIE